MTFCIVKLIYQRGRSAIGDTWHVPHQHDRPAVADDVHGPPNWATVVVDARLFPGGL